MFSLSFNQTYPNLELIIIVDGASFEIKNELEKYSKDFSIKLFFNDTIIGISNARNIGIKLASGDIIAFIDDDAVAFEDWAENTVKCYRGDVVATRGKVIPKSPPFHKIILAISNDFGDNERIISHLIGCNMSFKKSVFSEVGLFNPSIDYGNDETELSLRLTAKGYNILYCPKAIVKHDNARTWKKLLWKNYKFGENSQYLSSKASYLNKTLPYESKFNRLIRGFQETRSISVILGLAILFVVRRIGVVMGIIKNIIRSILK